MKSSILREIERKQATLPVEERFDLSAAKRLNKSRQKQPSVADREACRRFVGGPRSVMGRPFGESFSD